MIDRLDHFAHQHLGGDVNAAARQVTQLRRQRFPGWFGFAGQRQTQNLAMLGFG